MKTATRALVAFVLTAFAAAAAAQSPTAAAPAAAPAKPKKPVYVQDFVGSYEPASSSQGRGAP
jgi:hypothetical protein